MRDNANEHASHLCSAVKHCCAKKTGVSGVLGFLAMCAAEGRTQS